MIVSYRMRIDYRSKAAAKRPRTTAIEEDDRQAAELWLGGYADVEPPVPIARALKAAKVLADASSVLAAKTIPDLQCVPCLQKAQIGFD